jgi:hypothetical protein
MDYVVKEIFLNKSIYMGDRTEYHGKIGDGRVKSMQFDPTKGVLLIDVRARIHFIPLSNIYDVVLESEPKDDKPTTNKKPTGASGS